MNEQQLKALQEKLDDLIVSNRQQADYAKRTWIMSVISAACVILLCAFIAAVTVFFLPKVNSLLGQAQSSLESVEQVVENINAEMDKTDIAKLVNSVTGLVEETKTDLTETFESVNDIDFDSLNKAIQDLSDVIEPLAKFFGTFK